ncbi:MAG TPA: hypothetical protein VF491_21905 [Vicinamibacterales bacterium]
MGFAFLILIALFVSNAAAQTAPRWVILGATPADDVEQRLTQVLRDRVGRVLRSDASTDVLTPAGFEKALPDFDANQTIFLVTDPASLGEVSARGGWQALARRGFELVSPRIWGRTLYVFAACAAPTTSGCGELDRNARLTGYVRWAGSQDPEIRSRASIILRRLGYANVDFTFMSRPDAMASGLRGSANGGVDIVCIFEEEPSGFLNEFASQLKTRARLVSVEQQSDAASLEVNAGIPSIAIPYDSQRFYRFNANIDVPAAPAATRVPAVMVTPPPAVPDPRAFTLPLLLTNARRTGDLTRIEGALKSSLSQVTSVAYLRTLFDEDESRCDSRDRVSSEQFKTVLLNSFFADRGNPYAVLGLFGHLVFAQKSTPTDLRAVQVFEDILMNEYKVPRTSAEGISKWLRDQTRITKVDLRARFANYPPEQMYSETIAGLGPALREPRPAERRRLLERARDTLVSLAEVALPSTCGKREVQRGLWTGMDFEPFFYLAVINAALTEIGPAQ